MQVGDKVRFKDAGIADKLRCPVEANVLELLGDRVRISGCDPSLPADWFEVIPPAAADTTVQVQGFAVDPSWPLQIKGFEMPVPELGPSPVSGPLFPKIAEYERGLEGRIAELEAENAKLIEGCKSALCENIELRNQVQTLTEERDMFRRNGSENDSDVVKYLREQIATLTKQLREARSAVVDRQDLGEDRAPVRGTESGVVDEGAIAELQRRVTSLERKMAMFEV